MVTFRGSGDSLIFSIHYLFIYIHFLLVAIVIKIKVATNGIKIFICIAIYVPDREHMFPKRISGTYYSIVLILSTTLFAFCLARLTNSSPATTTPIRRLPLILGLPNNLSLTLSSSIASSKLSYST